ncbi:MAG: TIGR03619 family F420-dependent LLM class oxidoreductase [Pseudomonadota bacterium]
MKFGLFATFMSPRADRQMIRDFAQQCESIGLDSIWMGEHVVLFDETEHPYPGSKDGKIPVPEGGGMLDTVGTIGYMSAVTERLRFGTGITLVSQRNPVYTAKEFTTLDWLSGGRVDFGIGVGWCKEEVLASGYTWEDRGARTDEFLQLVKSFWTDQTTQFSGAHFNVPACHMDPKPLQNPHIPIFVGGHSQPALRRAAKYGDGWYGFQLTPEQAAPIVHELHTLRAAAGRDHLPFEIVITPGHINSEQIAQFEALGIKRLVLHLGSQKAEKVEMRLREVEALISA